MLDTIDALHLAVMASPEDRTVRLVYADALEETGEGINAARAEFIRIQIALEARSDPDLQDAALSARRDELFEEHWLAWWALVCPAAGLPDPHVPGRRVRNRVPSSIRRPRRPANWPYTHTTIDATVHALDYGLSVRFAGGFPEEVLVHTLNVPEAGPEIIHRWGDAMPLTQLAFNSAVTTAEWESVDGPHLNRLSSLTFDQLPPEVATLVAQSPHLAALTRLGASLATSDVEAIEALIACPTWMDLRALRLTSRLRPDELRAVATRCTLEHLEELELTLGTPGELVNPIGEIINGLLRLFRHSVSYSPPAFRWEEFGPPLELLTAVPWVKRLRRLTIRTAEPAGFRALFVGLLGGDPGAQDNVLPARAILALAAALCADKLERLVLPAAVIDPSTREELTTRLGDRVAFT